MKYLILILCLLLSSCADSVSFTQAAAMEPVGFWYGLWHGWICGIAWIVSLFIGSTAIYAVYKELKLYWMARNAFGAAKILRLKRIKFYPVIPGALV